MTFKRLVLLAPAAYVLHIIEERPRFVAWTRLYPSLFSATLSNTVFAVTNAVYMLLLVLAVVLCVQRSAKTLLFDLFVLFVSSWWGISWSAGLVS